MTETRDRQIRFGSGRRQKLRAVIAEDDAFDLLAGPAATDEPDIDLNTADVLSFIKSDYNIGVGRVASADAIVVDEEVTARNKQAVFRDELRLVFDRYYLYQHSEGLHWWPQRTRSGVERAVETTDLANLLYRQLAEQFRSDPEESDLELDYSDVGPSIDVFIPEDVDWAAAPETESFSTLFDVEYESEDAGSEGL